MQPFRQGECIMRRTVVCTGIAVLLTAIATVPVSAGGKSRSCYEQAVIPATYQTVQQQVLVRKASKHVVKQPAVYSFQTKHVVVQPGRITYRTIAPIYSVRQRQVMVSPASYGWEYQVRHGRKILCKVKHPAVYQTVQERVLVQPGSRVAVRQPAIYGKVKQKVLVQPASSQVVHQPAVYQTVTRQVKVRDQQVVWQPIRTRGSCRH